MLDHNQKIKHRNQTFNKNCRTYEKNLLNNDNCVLKIPYKLACRKFLNLHNIPSYFRAINLKTAKSIKISLLRSRYISAKLGYITTNDRVSLITNTSGTIASYRHKLIRPVIKVSLEVPRNRCEYVDEATRLPTFSIAYLIPQ